MILRRQVLAAVLAVVVAAPILAQGPPSGKGKGRQQGASGQGQFGQGQFGKGQAGQGQFGQGAGGRGNQRGAGAGNTSVGGQEAYALWEEEKLARDVYRALSKSSNLNVFNVISRSEQQHMGAVSRMLGGQQLNDQEGVFSVPEYQKLYQELVATGNKSPTDALLVGAKIEEMDIWDLQQMQQAGGADPSVARILENLERASRNHLRAFAAELNKLGVNYEASFLSQAEFDRIANSPQESGNGQRQGAGGQSSGRQAAGQQSGQRQNRGNTRGRGRKP
ncbi:MAG: DUF2202 domain-containing protein [bacterium]|nr:DUF2202 domain-containing protein [bacterium]